MVINMDFIYKNKKVPLPTVRQFYVLKYLETYEAEEVLEVICELISGVETVYDVFDFSDKFVSWLEEQRNKNPDLKTPYAPPEKKYPRYYNCNTADMKQVSEYTKLNFSQVEELNVFVFWRYLHDCIVWQGEQTETGREYLENAHIYEQTKPDRKALREIFSEKEEA